ncbi:MAG TPA: DRTGG domain-containing protein [Bacilli bacterium]
MDELQENSLTKHDLIIKYIANLKAGSKISVRKTAKDMRVSEGTAYKAIKSAENQGLLSTRDRIGTIRIEQRKRNGLDKLTFAEVVQIVGGDVLGGSNGLHKTLNKFVIGAMQQDAMKQYIEAGSLLIVGNRYEVHSFALEQGAGVLITGGFHTKDEVKRRADELDLPVISCSYDTFTVASMINRAIYDNQIKKKIMLVDDIISSNDKVYMLKNSSTMKDWNKLKEETGYSRYPVVDEWNRVVGMVTSKDVAGAELDQTMDKLMTRNPVTVHLNTSIASAAHMMMWEGIELLPVVESNRKLIGTISRQEVLKAMHLTQKQHQTGETIEDIIWSGFEEERTEQGLLIFRGMITPQMTNRLGTVSEGVLTTLMNKAAYRAIREIKKGDLVMENMSSYYIKPLQIESNVEIRPRIMEISRKFGKVEVEVTHRGSLICKAMLTAQIIDPS